MEVAIKRNNVNVHRAAANIIVSKSRATRGSVCNVLLSRVIGVPLNDQRSKLSRLFLNVYPAASHYDFVPQVFHVKVFILKL